MSWLSRILRIKDLVSIVRTLKSSILIVAKEGVASHVGISNLYIVMTIIRVLNFLGPCGLRGMLCSEYLRVKKELLCDANFD